VVMHDTTNGLQ